jgi:hypothetical protein
MGKTATAWYWRSVSGGPLDSRPPVPVVAVIERLRATPAGWVAAAAAVREIARRIDLSRLFGLLPEETITGWLRDMGDAGAAYAPPIRLPIPFPAEIARLVSTYGPQSHTALWLAALGVVSAQPDRAETRTVVPIARACLLATAMSTPHEPERRAIAELSAHALEDGRTPPEFLSPNLLRRSIAPTEQGAQPVERRTTAHQTWRDPRPTLSESFFGEPTCGAGLYFLLHVLRHLEIEQQEFGIPFLAELFLRIAAHAGVPPSDPILQWAEIVQEQSEPASFDNRQVRIWVLRIRRWCWRNGRLAVREIVRRPGYVTLTSTDLDVTMSIDSADVRIRRIGLDLDPGWLPWFGRVVRFHYRVRGEICG